MQNSRLIPLIVAGMICFASAFVLGAGFWYLLGTKTHSGMGSNTIVQVSNQNAPANSFPENTNAINANQNTNAAFPPKQAEIKLAPAGEIKITGGEVLLGGEDTKMPLRRVNVDDFAIGETEVTNAQYAEFVEDSKHPAPAGWKDGKVAPGTDDYPVVGVTWTDANDYCDWLSKKINATVRLPSEAEWERAARGDKTDYKYPWGISWKDSAVLPDGATKGKILPVKSAPDGRSPFGVYEMSGNVWEWTSDLWTDEFGKPVLYGKSQQRVIKGGSVKESFLENTEREKYLTIDARLNRPEGKASELLGFRYVIIRQG